MIQYNVYLFQNLILLYTYILVNTNINILNCTYIHTRCRCICLFKGCVSKQWEIPQWLLVVAGFGGWFPSAEKRVAPPEAGLHVEMSAPVITDWRDLKHRSLSKGPSIRMTIWYYDDEWCLLYWYVILIDMVRNAVFQPPCWLPVCNRAKKPWRYKKRRKPKSLGKSLGNYAYHIQLFHAIYDNYGL